jgi:hypothetical protein
MLATVDGLDAMNHADAELARIRCPTGEVDNSGRTHTAAARIDVVTVDVKQPGD